MQLQFIAKIVPFFLVFALTGCSHGDHPENAASIMSKKIQQWIPPGTPLPSARQIMEQHAFACTVDSYTNIDSMIHDPAAIRWKTGIIRNGKPEAVTNISNLNCDETNAGRKYNVIMTLINGQTEGILRVSASRIPSTPM